MKKTVLVCFFSIVAVFFISASASATNGMRMIGFGPVQNSMGGVSMGLPLDAAVILTNPAGMSFLPGRIDFGAAYFVPSVEYKAIGGASGSTIESDRGGSPVPAFGLIIPVGDRFRFGIVVYGVAGMGVDYPADLYGSTTYTAYSQMRFAPGLS